MKLYLPDNKMKDNFHHGKSKYDNIRHPYITYMSNKENFFSFRHSIKLLQRRLAITNDPYWNFWR